VSEQNAEQSSGEPGSLGAGPAVPHSSEAQGAAGPADAPKVDAAKADASKADASNKEVPQADAPRAPGKVLIMSAGDRNWDSSAADAGMKSESGSAMFGKRRVSAMAAVVALAMVAGALGGALATAGLTHFAGGDAASAGNGAIEASVARIDADILALKASVEHTSRTGTPNSTRPTTASTRSRRRKPSPPPNWRNSARPSTSFA
jgi:hypothetical protein